MANVGDKSFTTEMLRATKVAASKGLGDYAYIKRYIGTVSAVDYSTNSASVKILGSSTGSTGFKLRQGAIPIVNDNVVVCMAGQERWVEAVLAGNTQPKVGLLSDGTLQFGPGGAAYDTNLYRSAANTLKTDDALVVAGATTLNGTVSGLGTTVHSISPSSFTIANATQTDVTGGSVTFTPTVAEKVLINVIFDCSQTATPTVAVTVYLGLKINTVQQGHYARWSVAANHTSPTSLSIAQTYLYEAAAGVAVTLQLTGHKSTTTNAGTYTTGAYTRLGVLRVPA